MLLLCKVKCNVREQRPRLMSVKSTLCFLVDVLHLEEEGFFSQFKINVITLTYEQIQFAVHSTDGMAIHYNELVMRINPNMQISI